MESINKYRKAGDTYPFLSGGGEMGALMRHKDWSASAIGSPDTWPQSLRTTLSILLNSRFPMFLFWGPDHICFYNDAYRPSLGISGKHPDILGARGEDHWQEIWDTIKPLIDQVLSGGEASWNEDQLLPIYRNGKIEDVYWTYSYSPVHDESNKPAGVFVTCSETTEKILAYKNLKESRDQLQFALDAADLATWDIDPDTLVFTGSERLKEWHGLPPGEEFAFELGLTAVAPEDREKLKAALNLALNPAAGGKMDLEYTINNLVTGQSRIVRTKGTTSFDEEGKPVAVRGTVQDITSQALAKRKIEQSEKRFRNTVEQAPLGITILRGPEFIVEMANKNYLELVDREEKDFVGHALFAALPEVKDAVAPLLKEVIETGNPFYGFEFPVTLNRFGKKESTYFNFVYHPLREDDGEITGVIVVAIEVTSSVTAKHALLESEKQFRNMVMQSPIPMTILRGSGYIVEAANRTMFENIWRKKEEEVKGKGLLEVFPELNDQKYAALLNEVFTTGRAYRENESIAYVQGDDGMKKFYLDFEYAPLYDTANKIDGIIITVNDVTEKVEARKRLEASEQEFRQLADSLPELVWTTDAAGNQTFASGRWKEYTGLDPYDETSFVKMVHPDDLEKLLRIWKGCLDSGNYYTAQARLREKSGEYQWFYVNGEAIRDENGNIEKWIGAFTNFNEQKKAEERLMEAIRKIEESENRLNIVIESSELGTWELHLKTGDINYSHRYLEILGYPPDAVLTHADIVGHLHPDDLRHRELAFQRAYATGVLFYETRVIWGDGSIHWVEGKGKVFYDDNNQPSLMIGTARDITEDKYYQKQLEDREQKFRMLADSMPEFVWTGDVHGNLNYFNVSMYRYSGLGRKQLVNDGWLQIIHPDDREEHVRRWKESIRTGKNFLHEHRFRREDGEYRWQLSRATPQRDIHGNIQMWVGVSTDIQEIKQLDQQKDFFISTASHELKTPITSIKGYVQMLQSIHNKGEDNFLKSSLRVIDKQVGTLTNLISDLLDLSKIKSGGLVLNREDFSVNELTAEIVDEMRHIHPDYEFRFLPGVDMNVSADRERIGQVLKNFLTNAVKYSPASRMVTIDTRREDDNILVSVTDAGIGISKNDQLKIFERFYRVEGKNEKTFPGFGIGLFISSEIIQRHQGKIGVESEPGKGSVFYFSLPGITD